MRILVTGSAGLIGGDAVRTLVDARNEVVPVTRSTGASDAGLPATVSLDLRSVGAISALVAQAPDLIVHAAGVLPVTFDGKHAASAASDNRAMDDVVFAATADLGCPLIYISSTSLYGCVQTLCSEDSPVNPRGPYGEEKYRSERSVLELDVRRVILRVSAPYGPVQRSMTVLRKFVQLASRGDNLVYYGTGAREQDFTAVEDISSAIVAAATGTGSGIFNIASGKPITMKSLAHLVIATVGTRVSRALASGVDDPEEHCRARIAIVKAERELHWTPLVDLATGIRGLASESPHPATTQRSEPADDASNRK